MALAAFHVRMALLLASFIALTVGVSAFTGHSVENAGGLTAAVLAAVAVLTPIPVYAHDRGRTDFRESTLALLWALAFAVVLQLPVISLARLDAPLQDRRFALLDKAMGISVPALAVWSHAHGIGTLLDRVYELLIPWIPISTFAVCLSGKWMRARVFVAANVVAFLIGLPLFALFPAIGPWYGAAILPNPAQVQCQNSLLGLRAGASALVVGVVCFPSFHVIWAVLCGYAFSGLRWLRIPAWILAGLIVVSTVTSGWHYVVDVIAGLLIAAAALRVAKWLSIPKEAVSEQSFEMASSESAVVND